MEEVSCCCPALWNVVEADVGSGVELAGQAGGWKWKAGGVRGWLAYAVKARRAWTMDWVVDIAEQWLMKQG